MAFVTKKFGWWNINGIFKWFDCKHLYKNI